MEKSAVVLSALKSASKKGASLSWKGARWSANKGYEVSKPAVIAIASKARADKRIAIGLAAGAGVFLLTISLLAYAFLGRGKKQDTVEEQLAADTNAKSFDDIFESPKEKPAPRPAVPMSGTLAPDVLKKVKRSTLFLRVESGNGQVGSGSGFFSFEPGIVLTNAHVVGMLHNDSSAPRKIDAVLNSGEKDEKTFAARVLDVDRSSDLAVLRLSGDSDGLPEPLPVSSAKELIETQQVYIFGFPFGESLGKNITISTSSVSSLRKNDQGELAQIQVNGGMNPGNSGGPVVDPLGNVIGVAVAGIQGTSINFAIPGDYVHVILNGRIKDVTYGTPSRRGDSVAVPVTVRTIDPLKRIKRVGIDWWLGNAGDNRPPATSQPEAVRGDGERQTVFLTYRGDTAQGELLLPGDPERKAYWVQPLFVGNASQKQWTAANVLVPDIVDAKPATLLVKHQVGEVKLNVRGKTSYKLHNNDNDHTYVSGFEAKMLEVTREVDLSGNAQRRLQISKLELTELRDGRPSTRMPDVRNIDQIGFEVTADRQGNLPQKRVNLGSQVVLQALSERVLLAVDVNAVPFMGSNLSPGQTWQAMRLVPIDTVRGTTRAQLDLTYTYRGIRVRNGRDEAVLGVSGALRGVQGINAKVRGSAAFDPTFGQVTQAQTILDLSFHVAPFQIDGSTEFAIERIPPDAGAK